MGKLILLLALLIVAAGAMYLFAVPRETTPPAAARTGPPAGAEFVEESPESILGTFASARPGQRNAISEAYYGLWVPAEGWEGVVEQITSEREGPALRIHRASPSMPGGGCWVIALVAPDHGIQQGQRVRIQGAIRDIRVQGSAGTIAASIVLENARTVGP